MSRIGKKPLAIPQNVKCSVSPSAIVVEGPKGKLEFKPSTRVQAVIKDSVLTFTRVSDAITDKALHGTTRSVVANMIIGVTDGFVKELLIEGVGFKAQVQGRQLNMALGFTHPVLFDIPEGLTVETPKPTHLLVKGIDKGKVGLFAAKIHKAFEAEPYKGKGIRYAGETIRRKAGKTVTK